MVKIISEIGINHNGDIEIAKKLIMLSKVAGCDYVKIQKRNPDVCVPENQKSKMRDTPWGRITYLEYKKKIEFEQRLAGSAWLLLGLRHRQARNKQRKA